MTDLTKVQQTEATKIANAENVHNADDVIACS
jgi:hypothetical protein